MRTLTDPAYGPHARSVLDLYLPDRPSRGGALAVCLHGGGWTSGDKKDWAWEAARLAEGGLAAADEPCDVLIPWGPRDTAPGETPGTFDPGQ